MKLLASVTVLLAVMAGTAACTPAEESAPTPAPTPSGSSAVPTGLPTAQTAGSDGLTVRYRDEAGTLRTVRVEDFPH